jgi:DNA-binding PadR family transcriptional regulator
MRRPHTQDDEPLPLTPAEFHVLLSLVDVERHGYAIIQDVRERTGGQVQLRTGTLYTVIKRMLDSHWLAEADAPGDETDERRRYYALTAAGRTALRTEAKRMESLVALAHRKRVLARPKLERERPR